MTVTRTACALLVSLLFVLVPALARAESGATLVAIVTSEPNSALTRRVKAELEGLGVDVLVLKPPDEASTSRAPLEQAARGIGAAAAIRLVPSSEGKVEVWVADRVTGKTVVRELDAANTNASDASVAVGTVELLRASLMELHTPEPTRGEVKPTPKIEALALPARPPPPAPPRLGLAFSFGAELGVRGLGPSADGRLAFWLRLYDKLGLRVLGDATLIPSSSDTTSGSVDVRSVWFGAALVYAFTPLDSRWVPEVSLGMSAAHVTTSGTARAPYVGTSSSVWAAAPFAGMGLGLTLVRGLRLRADALVAWALPGVRVRTPTEDVGRWGAPAVMLSPGIEVLWSP